MGITDRDADLPPMNLFDLLSNERCDGIMARLKARGSSSGGARGMCAPLMRKNRFGTIPSDWLS